MVAATASAGKRAWWFVVCGWWSDGAKGKVGKGVGCLAGDDTDTHAFGRIGRIGVCSVCTGSFRREREERKAERGSDQKGKEMQM